MDKQLAANFQFHIEAFRITKNGGAKLTLSIPENFAAKAAALALQNDTIFEADLFVVENQVFGSKKA